MKMYKVKNLASTISEDVEKAQYLARKIQDYQYFELLAPVRMSIVCFRYRSKLSEREVDMFNQNLLKIIEKDGRIFLAGTKA